MHVIDIGDFLQLLNSVLFTSCFCEMRILAKNMKIRDVPFLIQNAKEDIGQFC